MPKDNTVILEDGEMNEIDRELEEFKRFCLIITETTEEPSKDCCASEPGGPCF